MAEHSIQSLLNATEDQYRVIGISTDHLSREDRDYLESLAKDPAIGMVMGRDTGWFLKLYEDLDLNLDYPAMSPSLQAIITCVHMAGFRMIEFDCDATSYEVWEMHEE